MDNPTYRRMGDHTETVQVDFDPQIITYGELLALFWNSHQPTSQSGKRQYLNAVFFHTDWQEQQARDSKMAVERRLGRPVRTEVLPLHTFTRAEDYHQKYLLKRHADLMRELSSIYPDHRDLVDSTAAARLNAYAGGYGSPEQFAQEVDQLGLNPKSREKLKNIVSRNRRLN